MERREFLILGLVFTTSAYAQMFQTVPEANATLIQSGKDKYACPNCGMHLVKFYKTSHTHENHQYCSIHCLYEVTQGVIPEDAKVVDTITLELIDVKKAFYVVGSNVKGTMTRTSSYAFGSEKEAQNFISNNGGKMMNFQEAYAVAAEDFPEDFGKKATASTVVPVTKIEVPKDAKCPICGMFVAKYPQWVALYDGDKKFYFDGVKDMMKYAYARKLSSDKFYVSDYYKLSKLEASQAFYVIGSNVYGPMGNELIPFATQEEAQSFARDHNGQKVIAFDEITEAMVKSL
ncbi:NosL family protein [Sulfurospirillum diekertiae]|uniref:NosL family protein n=1 Tax=Sulfurospirillum diekertiae TaxID=1854492 RepID=A0A290HV04_9BACT|nr:nitrous oxide reductase accessory protein NosL [Sulfurospirillum diekertiae]ATB69189.1 NosL family protein [Sulfurospirillum diekertiae]